MSITERQRSHLTETATTVLGAEAADTLMALLPMDGWDNIVREPDLRAATAELRADMAELRNDVRTEISDVRTEITDEYLDTKLDAHIHGHHHQRRDRDSTTDPIAPITRAKRTPARPA